MNQPLIKRCVGSVVLIKFRSGFVRLRCFTPRKTVWKGS